MIAARLIALLWVVLVLQVKVPARAEFRYDPGNKSIFHSNDDSSCVSDESCFYRLDPPIQFYGNNYNYCIINTNGIVELTDHMIELDETLRHVNSSSLPIQNHVLIAPFYANIDTRGDAGSVLYSNDVTTEPGALQKAADQISKGFSEYENFTAEYLIIATWDDVGYYDKQNDKLNSFQCVIATNGSMTFAIFLYVELQWSTAQDNIAARAGFNDGINEESWEMPCSGTADITDAASTSNVNTSGVWLFRIDQENIIPACVKEMCASDALCSCLTEDKENCKCKCSESSDSCKVDQEEVCTNPEPTTGGVTPTTEPPVLTIVLSIVLPIVAGIVITIIIVHYVVKYCKKTHPKSENGKDEMSSQQKKRNDHHDT